MMKVENKSAITDQITDTGTIFESGSGIQHITDTAIPYISTSRIGFMREKTNPTVLETVPNPTAPVPIGLGKNLCYRSTSKRVNPNLSQYPLGAYFRISYADRAVVNLINENFSTLRVNKLAGHLSIIHSPEGYLLKYYFNKVVDLYRFIQSNLPNGVLLNDNNRSETALPEILAKCRSYI